MITLFQEEMVWEDQTCQSFQSSDPLKTSDSQVPVVDYTSCLSQWEGERQYTNFLGNLSACIQGHMSVETNNSALSLPPTDSWWYRREGVLLVTLLSNSSRTCSLVQLLIPLTLTFHNSNH
jgi:hypothetical protein